ncbi:uncharacterized protein LOC119905013 isoform X6 [Micropterus salmoides]|uniref:uncharacterized protein LOC119905013 isoform X5 n=1 Tax=Micropterus salmoides TaxID=27706 RepID=UPI0018EDADEF|nr:uncharacterized protein LOC119905013 isoform X5 [Micropterus salmoides]XP_038577613.1 uncharacterized protein LOC119905013 isoform X6 [Micropterus salmoides]
MKVRHTLICFFFLSLQDGNTGLTNAQITSVHTGTEGGDIRVGCSFSSYGTSMFFCKRECKPEDILIHTTGVRDQRGRYSITYEGGENVVVSITQLTKSDSGLYSCGLGGSNIKFEIIVVDDPSASKPTQISQTDQQQTGTASPRDVWLPVGLTLAIMIVLLLLAVVIYCRKRSSKPKGAPVETEYPSVTETNQVYENIREDRHSRSAPVEISSVYTLAKYTHKKTPESTDDYSSVSESRFQNTAEDHSSKFTYSEVNFSKQSNRAPW